MTAPSVVGTFGHGPTAHVPAGSDAPETPSAARGGSVVGGREHLAGGHSVAIGVAYGRHGRGHGHAGPTRRRPPGRGGGRASPREPAVGRAGGRPGTAPTLAAGGCRDRSRPAFTRSAVGQGPGAVVRPGRAFGEAAWAWAWRQIPARSAAAPSPSVLLLLRPARRILPPAAGRRAAAGSRCRGRRPARARGRARPEGRFVRGVRP